MNWRLLTIIGTAAAVAIVILSGSIIQRNVSSIAQLRLAYGDEAPYRQDPLDEHSPYLAATRAYIAGEYDTAYALLSEAPERPGLTQWLKLRALSSAGRWEAVLDSADLNQSKEREIFAATFVAHEDEMTVRQRTQYLKEMQNSPVQLLAYVWQLLRAQRFTEAAEIAHSITDPDWSDDARLLEARAYFHGKDWKQARAILEELVAKSHSPSVLYWHGRTRYEQGERQAGLDDISASLEGLPKHASLDNFIMYARLLQVAGQCETAVEFLISLNDDIGDSGTAELRDALSKAEECH